MSAESALPDFASTRAKTPRYTVERESRPHNDDERIRIQDEGTPSSLRVLICIRAANAEGWRLDKHSDHGSELVFVPFERQ